MKKMIVVSMILALSCPVASMAVDEKGAGTNVDAATSVKSGKSNSSDRTTGNGGNTDAATTVKSSKSNSSERQAGSAAGTTVKGSKSNTSE